MYNFALLGKRLPYTSMFTVIIRITSNFRPQDLPSSGEYINSLDQEMLLLKATSNATMACLEQCLSILQHQQVKAVNNITVN